MSKTSAKEVLKEEKSLQDRNDSNHPPEVKLTRALSVLKSICTKENLEKCDHALRIALKLRAIFGLDE